MCPPGLAPHDQQRPGREPDGDLAAGGEAPEHHEDAAGQGQREDGGRGAVVGVHVGRDTLAICRVARDNATICCCCAADLAGEVSVDRQLVGHLVAMAQTDRPLGHSQAGGGDGGIRQRAV